MLVRIVLVALVVMGAMFAIKSGTILRGAGLLSNCEIIEAPNGAVGVMRECTEGKLDGRQDLSDTCKRMGERAGKEYWTCPQGRRLSGS
jgi:hypothetical protein